MNIKKATKEDIEIILDMKMRMSKELRITEVFQENVEEKIKEKYLSLYQEDKCCHFLIYEDEKVVAIGGAIVKEDIPFCFFKTPYYGFVMDMYSLPEKRKRGYATKIMEELLKWLKEKGVHNVRLKPSLEGRLLYEKLGFQSAGEMQKNI